MLYDAEIQTLPLLATFAQRRDITVPAKISRQLFYFLDTILEGSACRSLPEARSG